MNKLAIAFLVLAVLIGIGIFLIPDRNDYSENSSELLPKQDQSVPLERSESEFSAADTLDLIPELNREISVTINGVKYRLERADLAETRVQEIVEMATDEKTEHFPQHNDDVPQIRSEGEAFKHFVGKISMVSWPRVFFTKGDSYYFSGDGGAEPVSDFSSGYRVTKEGQIRIW